MNNNAVKEEKLAAARRKLKEFQIQQRNKENVDTVASAYSKECKIFENDAIILPQEVYCNLDHDENKKEFLNIHTNDEQQTDISNYFSNNNKNDVFFDTVQNPISAQSVPNNYRESLISENSSTCVNSFLPETPCTENISINSKVALKPLPNATENLEKQENEFLNSESLKKMKHSLLLAEAKIKMQAEALDIVTTEREEIQLKLINAMHEINVYKENALLLKKQLQESLKHQEELKVDLTELKQIRQESLAKESILEQNMNDLKEKNDELNHSLEMQKKKNNVLINQLEEAQSSRDMLTLRFQQLGIQTEGDTENYHAICEESNSIKQKYRELEEQLKTLMFEREHTDGEYREYIENMKEELCVTREELETLVTENQLLANKMSSQTEHINNLEKQLQKERVDENNENLIINLKNSIENIKQELEQEKEKNQHSLSQLSDYDHWKQKACNLEYDLETLKSEMMNSNELQMAVESNKVAASQAITQNNKLKAELERLSEIINSLENDKKVLNQMLDVEKSKNNELNDSLQVKTINDIVENAVVKNDAAINTEIDNEENNYGRTNLIAMLQLQEKFKSVLDKMADLTDEKQQLEHLVMQLQSETETIEEYVALYQKQRSILQQRTRETDFKIERVSEEKKCLLSVIRSILTTDVLNHSFIKQLVQCNLSAELNDELSQNTNLGSNFLKTSLKPFNDENNGHHPTCHCCSGKLITL